MSNRIDLVPKWTRAITGILALLNILYGSMGYFDLTLLFQNSIGLDLTNPSLQHASFEFAARNLAIGLALGIVALKGVPESITIVTIIRALVELQTIFISLSTGQVDVKILMPLVFLAVEILIIKTMIGVIKNRDSM